MTRIRDTYRSFTELAADNTAGRDYAIETENRGGGTVILAIHGGTIEPGTDVIARRIAGNDFSYYIFRGLAGRDGDKEALRLHITSTHFDEPHALRLVASANRAISIHGQYDEKRARVMIGGRNKDATGHIRTSLTEAGFAVEKPASMNSGMHKKNIVNRCRSGAGVQIEMSRKLRQTLHENPELLEQFVSAVRNSLPEE